jgi:hypothetical protein
MIIISTIIVMAVLALIANAAFAAITGRYSNYEVTPRQLTPEEQLKRAYLSAYYAHVSTLDECTPAQKSEKVVT